jgi:hypothetical protein
MGMNFTDMIAQFCTLKNLTDKPEVKKNQTKMAIAIITMISQDGSHPVPLQIA